MKNPICFLVYAALLLLIQISAHSQPKINDPKLLSQLAGKTKLEEIMQIVTKHYLQYPPNEMTLFNEDGSSPKGNPMTKWARWAYENSNRLDENGNITDYTGRIFEELMKLDKSGNIDLNSNVGSWQRLGPTSTVYGSNSQNFRGLGRVDRIAFHPSDANTIYIGTPAGGLWRTTNNGSSWVNLTPDLPTPGISGIVVSSNNPSSIYILTGDGDSNMGGLVQAMGYMRRSVGVMRTTDGGSSWFLTGALPSTNENLVGYKLVQDPNNANVLIAATNQGLFRTSNGGGTWTRVRTGRFWDVVFKHNSSTIVYATGDGVDRFVKSSDGGVIWSNTGFSWTPGTPSNTGRGQLAVGISATSAVYILWGPVVDTGVYRGLYYSGNEGLNWNRQSTTPNILGGADNGIDVGDQSSYDLALAVRPTNSTNIFTGGLTVWRSTDRGETMTKSTSFRESGAFSYIHPDVHDLKYHPTSGWLYAATDGGMYRSDNNGDTWTDISPGIATTQFYRGTGFDGNANLFLGGSQDNGVLYRPNVTNAFRFVLCCDGFDGKFYPDNSGKAYTSMNTRVFRLNLNGGGNDMNPWVNDKWFINVATHPTNGNTVYVGADSICRSDNEGVNWTVRRAINAGWYLTSCPSNVNRLYAAGGNSQWAASGNIRRSDNQGDTWTNINGTGFANTNLKVTCIGVRPTNSAFVWATIGGFSNGNKVFRTSQGDLASPAWTNVSGSLPNVPVNCIAVDAGNNAYIGTDIGVYYRGSGMADWVPFYNGLPRVPVSSLILNENAGVIKAVTFGHGVWESPVYSSCPANLSVSSNNWGYQVFEAGTELTSSVVVFGGDITEVYYKSNNRIILNPGFIALGGNRIFKAYISPCGSGIPTPDGLQEQILVDGRSLPGESITNYPFGAIIQTPVKGSGNNKVVLNVPEGGEYRILFSDKNEQFFDDAATTVQLNGGSNAIDLASVPVGAHFIMLLKGKTLCDIKEW